VREISLGDGTDLRIQHVTEQLDLLAPDIRAYLEAENRYTEALLGSTKSLQETLVREMRGRIKEDDSGVPVPDGPYAYLWKYREGGQHELIGRTPRDGGDVQVILDGDALAKVSAATLLIVGGLDRQVIELNRLAYDQLASASDKKLQIVDGATHLFEEPGTLAEVAGLAGQWFLEHLPAVEDESFRRKPR
jgi:pimeloyl-ACP methyl ester carboxylesterase